ncbi:potassium channel family protein [Aurantiacibacter sediminis]|uniref:TrkA family potassium uptake protein n=1 Tax=Aurantiacibacter sediminis TaxID=2793064 RepID=A0ABS0N1U9_9SPHN|nr:TrkA family potassium uptake protein [Aurantiacibacter sediminis]MBH5321935.1 TrkA family potassium uptake protein [Aurantiacibacter sediminis]
MSANRNPILVVGLGRFGGAVAETMERMGHEVLGADTDAALVQSYSSRLTQVVEADCTDIACLERLGAGDFDAAVVGIGDDIEASVLAVLALCDLGVKSIWAKANNERHGRILEKTGAHHVIFPEQKMGERVARLLNENLLDFISFDDSYAIAKLCAPEPIVGLPLVTSECRSKYNVTVIGVKRQGEGFIHADPDTLILPDDLLVVSGKTEDIEAFATI